MSGTKKTKSYVIEQEILLLNDNITSEKKKM